MAEGSVLVVFCETCDGETSHRVIRGEVSPDPQAGFDGTVQCQQCGSVHHVQIASERPVEVPVIVSDGETSRKTRLTLGPLEELRCGEELFIDGNNTLVTSITVAGAKRDRAKGSDIERITVKVFDTVPVKVAIVRGSTTRSETIMAAPDEEFEVGDILEFGPMKVVVESMLADRKVRREGDPVIARDIKRIYAKIMRERTY